MVLRPAAPSASRRLPAVSFLLGLALLSACTDGDRELGPSLDGGGDANAFSPPVYLEPAGMRLLTSNDWAGFALGTPTLGGTYGGWYRYASGNTGKAVVDASAGCGSSSALEVSFTQGMRQGTGPEHLAVGTGSGWMARQGSFKQLYLRYCAWVPANYYGSTNGVQKLFHIWGTTDASTSNTTAVPAIYGVGTGSLVHQLRLQNLSTANGARISLNLRCGAATRGRWDRVEVLITQNTGGQANGQAQMWLNGTSCMRVTNLTWSGAGRTVKQWTGVQLNPTYGGSGTVTTTQRLRYGAVRVSAK